MLNNLIFEIGTEEIPARFVSIALNQLNHNAKEIFSKSALSYKELKTFGTPRRLILSVNSLNEFQETRTKTVQGPAKNIAYNEKGELTKAGEGFAKSQGVLKENLQIKTTDRGEYIFAIKEEQGAKTIDVLKKILPDLILSFDFPKAMRWDSNLRFVRPIRWCLALYGAEPIEFKIGNISSGRITYGHRLRKNNAIEINHANDYFFTIKKSYVLIDPQERKKIILKKVKALSKIENAKPIYTDKLLDEVTNLVEYPEILIGNFSEEFLEVPKEVLIETMIVNQKYIPLQKQDGALLNKFIVVANNKDKNIIIEGNEKVLRARLSDAQFFYREDLKIPLTSKIEHLKKVLFQEELGTLYEKSLRIENLAAFIVNKINLKELEGSVRQCSKLCKVDLVTEMVKEFTALQGTMGAIYARKSEESEDVARGIFEHYLPRFAGDALPETKVGAVVSIADKLDTIVGCFIAGLIPSGSEDPYALRRQGIGIIEIMIKHEINIGCDELIKEAIKLYPQEKIPVNYNVKIIEFIIQRLRYVLEEKGIKFDALDAILSIPGTAIPIEIKEKAETIEKIKSNPNITPLVLSFKRVTNITKDFLKSEQINEELFKQDEEKKIFSLYKEVKIKIEKNLENKDYYEITNNLLEFTSPLENFFNKVLVMDEEPYRTNKIYLLKNIQELFFKFADLSKLVSN